MNATAIKVAIASFCAAATTFAPATMETADAATPRCVVRNLVYSVSGGCDGMGQAGHDRLVVRCRVSHTGSYADYYLAWHDRRGSWQQTALCGGGKYAWQAWIEHKNT